MQIINEFFKKVKAEKKGVWSVSPNKSAPKKMRIQSLEGLIQEDTQ